MVMDLRHKPYDESSSATYDEAVTSGMECPTLDSFEELCKALAERIDKNETRERGRTAEAKQNLLTSVHHLVSQLWKGTQIHEGYEAGINKRSGWYSEIERYRHPGLTYRQTIAAYDGLRQLGLISETRNGYLDRDTFEADITKFVANDELLEMLSELKEDPLKALTPNLNAECIILRNTVDGRREQVDYLDTPSVKEMRDNLRFINECLSRHWADIRIKDEDFISLQERLLIDDEKQPIDFSRWALVRIFSNGSFEQGGRFYRGWWQQVPSEWRRYITIGGKKTCEYDYSQLNPHMVYFLRDEELGDEDAYDRVFDGEHRPLVKEAFNAMIQASTRLTQKPRGIDLSDVDMDWPTLRDAILNAHRAIEDMFFQGHGNHLQYIDSCIAEQVMLQFNRMDYPVLPVHDSFIMHHAFGDLGELEEAMRRAFYHHFKKDIKVKGEIGELMAGSFDGRDSDELSFDGLIDGEPEYTRWHVRN